MSIYQNALSESGFKEELNHAPSGTNFQEENNQRTRRRKVIWFHLSYLRNMKMNINKIFLCLLVKHFPVNKKVLKMFNKNIVKVYKL